MNCVRPPLLKKPSRGFAWSCGPCSRAQERKLEARNTPNFNQDGSTIEPEDDDYIDDEEDDVGNDASTTGNRHDAVDDSHHAGTAEQIYQASLWPYRYLGIHCKPEDALDYDDRIYPRASSRLGPKHQANVLPWPGRPVKYVKPLEVKRTGRDKRLSKEAQAALDREKKAREKRPKWIQDEPPGYIPRGEDLPEDDPNNTCSLVWKPPEETQHKISSQEIDEYMKKAKEVAPAFALSKDSTNLLDVARDLLYETRFDTNAALAQLRHAEKARFKEPELTVAEQKKFEEAVSKFGSELHFVTKHVKTLSPGTVVRYYYVWKKTERGKQTWGNYSGRKVKKEAKLAEAAANKIQDDVADDADDSAFDTMKAIEKKRAFICKFCNTKNSRQWRRAPTGFAEATGKGKDKNIQFVQALCRRCAELWRRYAVQWEDIDDVAKKVAQAGGRAWKRKVDEELLKELVAANEMMKVVDSRPLPPRPALVNGSSTDSAQAAPQEPPRKKLRTGVPNREGGKDGKDSQDARVDHDAAMTDASSPNPPQTTTKKKDNKAAEKAAEKAQAPTPALEMPKPKVLPCAVCRQLEPLGDQHISCRECRLAVHRNCYGVLDNRNPGKWICDMCANDKSPQVAVRYQCVLCPIEYTEHDFVDPPKISHKKKTEKERERDRMERENAVNAAEFYRKKQIDMNRPVNPREALKRTADNNWVHVTCAVWTPEVKFANARALEPSEGIPSIPRARYADVCKACGGHGGACVACPTCRTPVHVECAQRYGYVLGFNITPVKGSRRDQFNIVSINGESGTMAAAIWCKEHAPTRTMIHRMHDVVNESGMNALQLYVQKFKQADLTLTGTARKALLVSLSSKMSTSPPSNPPHRRASAAGIAISAPSSTRSTDNSEPASSPEPEDKICITCGAGIAPRWWSLDKENEQLANSHADSIGEEAMRFVAQRAWQCHKCKKAKRRPSPIPPRKSPTPVEPLLTVSTPRTPVPTLTSPRPQTHSEPRAASIAYASSWMSPRSQKQAQPPSTTMPTSVAVGGTSVPTASTPIQPPMHAPTQPPAQPSIQTSIQPPVQPGTIQPPRTSSVTPRPPTLSHSSRGSVSTTLPPYSGSPFGDWPRRTSEQPNSANGSQSPVQRHSGIPAPNHLRPPPIPSIPPPAQTMASPHLMQPLTNGLPPSPRRLNPPPPLGNGSYLPPFQRSSRPPATVSHSSHQTHSVSQSPPTHNISHHHGPHGIGGGASPRVGDGYLPSLVGSRRPFPTHGSPPLTREATSRDNIPMSRDGSVPQRQQESRPSGASSNPSLRNLLS